MSELKQIPGWPEHSITQDGRVWSDISHRWLKTCFNKGSGGVLVSLRHNGHNHNVGVHRFLLKTFVSPCPPGMECRHLDGNPQNNSLENLCWGTRQENASDRVNHGRNITSTRKLFPWHVIWVKYLASLGRFTQSEIGRLFGVNQSTISACLKEAQQC